MILLPITQEEIDQLDANAIARYLETVTHIRHRLMERMALLDPEPDES